MCVVCSHVWPPWQQGSCHSYEASRHFSLEPDVLDCAPRGASLHPGTCTSAETHRDKILVQTGVTYELLAKCIEKADAGERIIYSYILVIVHGCFFSSGCC